MKKNIYEYTITMENGVRHVVKGTSKKMVENELQLLGLPNVLGDVRHFFCLVVSRH